MIGKIGADQNSDSPLTVAQLRFLDRIAGKGTDFIPPGYFEYEYHMDCQKTINDLFHSGYLAFSGPMDSVRLADMPTLRELAKKKGLKAGGKKSDIIQRILEKYTPAEMDELDLPRRYALTDKGTSILRENDALIRYFLTFSSREWTTPEAIISAQKAHPNLTGEEILIMMLNERIRKARTYSAKLPFCNYLLHFYHDDTSRQVLNRIIEAITSEADRELKQKRDRELKQSAAFFGVTEDELRTLHEKARHELVEEAKENDTTFVYSSDSQLMSRVNALESENRAAFYQVMEKHTKAKQDNDILSMLDYAWLTLDALERVSKDIPLTREAMIAKCILMLGE